MNIKKSLIKNLFLINICLTAASSALAGKIEFVEGREGNDYYKYPTTCTVLKHATETKYGFDTFCGENNDYAHYNVDYTSSYGDKYHELVQTGKNHFHSVNILPGKDPFIQTDFIITPDIKSD